MPASCAGCGDCCRVIGIKATPDDLRHTFFDVLRGRSIGHGGENATQIGLRLYERAFMLAHWAPITADEGRAIDPQLTASRVADGAALYVCDQYDPHTHRCASHLSGRKPNVCINFPWYGGQPNPVALTGFPRCSYWHDVPRELWPEGIDPLPSPDPEPENCC